MDKLLKFINTPQQHPDISTPEARKRHFEEIYAPFDPNRAATQAGRCSQCGIPFCQIHCPLQNNIPDWLMLTAEGRLQEAYTIASATNNFPEICGRICPQDKLCEGNCVIEHGFESVTIGQVEKHITETAFEQGWVQPIRVDQENSFSVAIIGAGPAGMAAAEELRKLGYAVHIYDRYDRVGGLMIYGIPNFKLDKHVVARREQLMRKSGIQFHLECAIGEHIALAELRARHDAVLIATGVYQARPLSVPNAAHEQIIPALTYLTASNRKGLGLSTPLPVYGGGLGLGQETAALSSRRQTEENAWDHLNAHGKKVVVIGGGDTAMDCVRTAVRQGATSITCLYRRDRANMPGSAREVRHAEEESVRFEWLSSPKAISCAPLPAGSGGKVAVKVEKMKLGSPDASGRLKPIPLPDSVYTLEADMVIAALGFEADDLPALFGEPDLQRNKWGNLAIDAHMMTSLPGVFAAGDIVRGASLVVWAIKDGREAAAAIDHYVMSSCEARSVRAGSQAVPCSGFDARRMTE